MYIYIITCVCLRSAIDDNTVTTTLTVERDGLYDVTVHKLLKEEDLSPETVFKCVLAIPETSYSIKEETMYFPGKGRCLLKISSLKTEPMGRT